MSEPTIGWKKITPENIPGPVDCVLARLPNNVLEFGFIHQDDMSRTGYVVSLLRSGIYRPCEYFMTQDDLLKLPKL